MAFMHGKTTTVLVGGFNLTSFLKEASVGTDMDIADTSVFGSTYKTGIPGLGGSTMNFSGLFESSADAIDEVLSDAIGVATGVVVSVGFDTSLAIGKRVFTVDAIESSYNVNGSISDVVSVSAAFSSRTNEGAKSGVSLHNHLTAEVVSTNSASVDNAAQSTNGGWGSLHVLASDDGNADETYAVKIQHSVDDAVWADLVTFSALTRGVPVAENIIVPAGTTVRRYLRAVSTLGGTTPSINFHANFVRG